MNLNAKLRGKPLSQISTMLLLGFDGGGTTTRAALIALKRSALENDRIEVLARGEAGSSNHYSVGLDGARANCEIAMNAALETAKTSRAQIEGFGFGLAGACSETEQAALRDALAPLCKSTRCVVEEDALAARAGAFAGGAGAILIAGTGANCFGLNEKNERARADGLGPLLGDRGGGYRIGESALRAICAAFDGAAPSTSLGVPCLKKLEVANVEGLVQLVYRSDFTRDRLAALFPLVLQEAQNGDEVSQRILAGAGAELAATARAVMQKLELKRVALTGGVLEHSMEVRAHFESALKTQIANLQIVAPRFDAAVGAALLLK